MKAIEYLEEGFMPNTPNTEKFVDYYRCLYLIKLAKQEVFDDIDLMFASDMSYGDCLPDELEKLKSVHGE